jgi:hypothetical protein
MKATHKYMAMTFDEFFLTDDWDVLMHWVSGKYDHPDTPSIWVRYGSTFMVLSDHIEYLTRRVLGKGI